MDSVMWPQTKPMRCETHFSQPIIAQVIWCQSVQSIHEYLSLYLRQYRQMLFSVEKPPRNFVSEQALKVYKPQPWKTELQS